MKVWIGCIGLGLTGCYTVLVRPVEQTDSRRERDVRQAVSFYESAYRPIFHLSRAYEEHNDLPSDRTSTRDPADWFHMPMTTPVISTPPDTARSFTRRERPQESLPSDGKRGFGLRTSNTVKREKVQL